MIIFPRFCDEFDKIWRGIESYLQNVICTNSLNFSKLIDGNEIILYVVYIFSNLPQFSAEIVKDELILL